MKTARRLIQTLRRSTLSLAFALGLSGTALAVLIGALVPPIAATLDYIPYGFRQRLGHTAPVHPAIVLITRDAETDARFGSGPIDHAVYGRTITALTRAGARVIGLDARLDGSSTPAHGGALSDAMLIEATRVAGQVVYPLAVRRQADGIEPATSTTLVHPAWVPVAAAVSRRLQGIEPVLQPLPALAQYPLNLGHDYAPADADGSARRVALFARIRDRAVPAFGMALAAAYLDVPPDGIVIRSNEILLRHADMAEAGIPDVVIPTDRRTRMVIGASSRLSEQAFASHALLDVWNVINRGDTDTLREWVADKIVVILSGEYASGRLPIEVGRGEAMTHVAALNAILTGSWSQEAAPGTIRLSALALATVAAWLLLSLPQPLAFIGVVLLGLGSLACAFVALWMDGLILPIFVPMAAMAGAVSGATLWLQFTAARRIEDLERQIAHVERRLAAVRNDLIARESAVERLEEDLEAANAAVARSVGKAHELVRSVANVRAELTEAKAQEERSRWLLQALEHELADLRVAGGEAEPSKDERPDLEREECERLGIVTRHPAVLGIYRDLKKAARSPIPVLILGEPGTGKELFARAAHVLSTRAQGPFVAVNMAAIAPDLFESELFGHAKGSFTGAVSDRKGFFEQAHRGTLFLDEIGDLRLDQQGKLLRVLQEHSLYRVGEHQPRSVDVRIVAATNKDLHQGVVQGWFREDLYFRLKGVVLRLPPLRERIEDLPLLASRFLKKAGLRIGRPHVALSEEALDALHGYRWPGNIRELHQCLEQAVALADHRLLTKADLRLPSSGALCIDGKDDNGDGTGDQEVLACLRRRHFDMQATARTLGWDRSTVTQRLKGLGFRALVESGGDLARAASRLAADPALAPTVELKLQDYYAHLVKTIRSYRTADEAIAACRKRFKNLPDRHFDAVTLLIKHHFAASTSGSTLSPTR